MTHIHGLGYLRTQSQDLDRWRTLLFEVLGFAPGSGPDDDTVYARMDERRHRLSVAPGEVDRVLAVGWEVRDQFALRALADDVERAGTSVKWLSAREAYHRGAEEAVTFEDPAGITLEVFHSPVLDHRPVVTPLGQRFLTGEQGMGHVVIPTTAPEETLAFYQQVLGFLPRGAFAIGPPSDEGPAPRVRFLGINQRHHSLAIVPAPHGEAPGMVHLMVEVDSLDAVGMALDRVHEHGFSISSTLGRHTNDKMVSFYVRAPGGWDIEYGTDGMRVDEDHYTAEEITADSYWGHDWSGSEPLAAFVPPSS